MILTFDGGKKSSSKKSSTIVNKNIEHNILTGHTHLLNDRLGENFTPMRLDVKVLHIEYAFFLPTFQNDLFNLPKFLTSQLG